jgi:mRNA-degrading endonuclease YafQ of YafQ-DinJ toxin-antitoxin module
MKKIVRTLTFRSHFRSRIQFDLELKEKYYQQVSLFMNGDIQATHPHALKGSMNGLKAFSISSDIRIIYREETTHYIFLDIGTHQQIYRS